MLATALRLVLAAAVTAAGCLAAAAQEPATFYKGRNVDIVVASPAGGGFDAYARIIARHIVKYLPGPPNFVIKNMPGAGGRQATAFLADVAPRDGTVILANQPGALVEQILGDPKQILYDPLKFQYIGSAEGFTSLCLLRNDGPVKSFAELQEKEAGKSCARLWRCRSSQENRAGLKTFGRDVPIQDCFANTLPP